MQLSSSQNVPFVNENGTIVITLTTSATNASDIVPLTNRMNDDFVDILNDAQILCSDSSIKPAILHTVDIEQELDDLASKDLSAELRGESENEDGCQDDDECEGEIEVEVEDCQQITVDHSISQYKDFPTKILDGCKFLYKGPDLLNMISRFYRLQCDQCE